MRLFAKVDGIVDRHDRPFSFGLPFDMAYGAVAIPAGATDEIFYLRRRLRTFYLPLRDTSFHLPARNKTFYLPQGAKR